MEGKAYCFQLSGHPYKRHKRYQFDMTEREVHDCIQILRALNPDMAVGFSQGERLALQSLYNTRDLGGGT